MKINTLLDRVVLERINTEAKIGSIIIPETAQKPQDRGRVVSLGPGKLLTEGEDRGKHFPIGLKVGEIVLFNRHAGSEVDVESVTYLVVREDDIIGVLEE